MGKGGMGGGGEVEGLAPGEKEGEGGGRQSDVT